MMDAPSTATLQSPATHRQTGVARRANAESCVPCSRRSNETIPVSTGQASGACITVSKPTRHSTQSICTTQTRRAPQCERRGAHREKKNKKGEPNSSFQPKPKREKVRPSPLFPPYIRCILSPRAGMSGQSVKRARTWIIPVIERFASAWLSRAIPYISSIATFCQTFIECSDRVWDAETRDCALHGKESAGTASPGRWGAPFVVLLTPGALRSARFVDTRSGRCPVYEWCDVSEGTRQQDPRSVVRELGRRVSLASASFCD